MEERDPSLEEVIRRARRAAGIGDHPPLPMLRNTSVADRTFWRLWVAGAIAPLVTGIITSLVGGASPLVVLLLVVGLCTLLVNIGLAGQTKGYAEGRLKALGQRVVGVTAWIGLALMGLVVATRPYALVIALSVLLLLGAVVGRDSRV